MKLVPLSGPSGLGLTALVDDDDFERVSRYRWYRLKVKKSLTIYARTTVDGSHVFMHNFILGKPKMGEWDHEDGNGLNNQRHNLCLVTHRVNIIKGMARRAYDAWKAGENKV